MRRKLAFLVTLVAAAVAASAAAAKPVPYKYLVTPGATQYARDGAFLDWGSRMSSQQQGVHFDSHGIPLHLIYGQYVYDPIDVAQDGIQEYSFYLLGKGQEHLDQALNDGNWVLANQTRSSGKWLYHFSFSTDDVLFHPPWISGIMQGQAMSFLTRLYRQTGRRAYLDAALRALRPFRRSPAHGGITDTLRGHPFYEEYPTRPPVHVLNGFILTLLGLYDLSPYSGEARRYYQEGRKTLTAVLHLYDAGKKGTLYHLGYLTYGDKPDIADCFYTRLHVILLDAINSIDENKVYERYRDRWYRLPCGSIPHT